MREERIHRINFHRVNAYLLETEDSIVLIDSGLSGGYTRIERALEDLGRTNTDIHLIVLTHTHYDHTGNAAECVRKSGAKVLVHRLEAEQLRKGFSPFPKGASPLGRCVIRLAGLLSFAGEAFDPVEADILMDEELDLHSSGFPGTALHTPSHSKGSLSLLTDRGACFPGDVLFNILPRSVYPPFADNPELLRGHWNMLLERGARMFYPGHGAPFSRERVEAALRKF